MNNEKMRNYTAYGHIDSRMNRFDDYPGYRDYNPYDRENTYHSSHIIS